MCNQQRKGKVFLILACLIMVVCLVQRIALLRVLQLPVLQTISMPSTSDRVDAVDHSSCELSAHSLLMASPLLFDCALPILMVLLAILALQPQAGGAYLAACAVASPVLRIHLKNCVFRE